MLDNVIKDAFRDARKSFGLIVRAGLIGALVGFLLTECSGFVFDGSWPSRVFVHFAALAFAIVVGYAASLTTGAVIVVGGLRSATKDLERITRSAMGMGGHYRTVDSVVDADA